jgi:hypothetical protein
VWAVDVEDLRQKVATEWDHDGWDMQAAALYVEYVDSLRSANQHGMRLLTGAIAAEIFGIATTGAVAVLVVAHLP